MLSIPLNFNVICNILICNTKIFYGLPPLSYNTGISKFKQLNQFFKGGSTRFKRLI